MPSTAFAKATRWHFEQSEAGMKALVQTGRGGPDVLQVKDWPDPEAGRGQVRIKVHACGLNFAELQARIGFYPEAPKPPAVLGYEVAGEVESMGEDVNDFEVGQRVFAMTRFGGNAELAVADKRSAIPMPDDMSFQEGAAIPVAYSTAYAALVLGANVQPEDKVLIHGAAGGVGIAATQLARHAGAEIFGTASAHKHDAIREQGVKHPIDYRNENVNDAVLEITGGEGLDVILDPRGGRAFKESYRLLRGGGRLVVFGVNQIMTGDKRSLFNAAKTMLLMPRFSATRLLNDSKSVIGINMLRYLDDRASLDNIIRPMRALIDEGIIKPVISEQFPLDRAADAHRYIQQRKNIGKVILNVR